MNAARTLAIFAVGSMALSGCFSAPQRPGPRRYRARRPALRRHHHRRPRRRLPRLLRRCWRFPTRFRASSRARHMAIRLSTTSLASATTVLPSSADYVELGVASWYGPGFHEIRTSTREPYDMYGMTAAHKTLPLPAYVRVTNLQNGRSIVVRVNDRGPFVGNRIIDLSYTAAAKLDMLRNGTAMVEVRSVGPTMPSIATSAVADTAPAPAAASGAAAARGAALYVQAGAFADPANADRLASKLRGGGYEKVFVRDDVIAGRRILSRAHRSGSGCPGIRPHRLRSRAGGCARCAPCHELIAAAATGRRQTPVHSATFYRRYSSIMHRSLSSLLLVAFAAFPIFAATPIPTAPAVDSRAYILVDYRTDKVLAAQDPDARMEPASLTKLMTAYIVFEQLATGKLKLDEPVVVSEHAWRSEGLPHLHRIG